MADSQQQNVSRTAWLPALLIAGVSVVALTNTGLAQSSITAGVQRPFVTGVIPVVGRGGAVGGVLVDAQGVVSRCDVDTAGKLRQARLAAGKPLPGDLSRTSQLRKISLRGLEAAIAERRKKGLPASDEIEYLAGLQRIRYVFVYPEQNDIVLAGFAEGWKVDQHGNLVGVTTGQPVLRLDDLVVALRSAEGAAKTVMSCSIDPTRQGVSRLNRFLKTKGLRMSRETVAHMERSLGPQQITLTGVEATSHFARVMVAADVRMKRLAMNFERAPIEGLPSYLQLLKSSTARLPRNMMPRWWLAPDYEPLLKDPEGLTWELRGPGVKAMTEEKSDPLVKKWARLLTDKYPELAAELPIFAELRNCIDLAVIAALMIQEDLTGKAGYSMPLLMNPKQIAAARFHVPKTLASRASFFKKGRSWVISVSGGVELNSWAVLAKMEERKSLSALRPKSAPPKAGSWWWD